MPFAIGAGEVVQRRAEDLLHGTDGAVEADEHAVGGHILHAKALAGEPRLYRGDVFLVRAELLAHLARGEPLVEVGRGRIIERGEIVVETLLLVVAALEHQGHRGDYLGGVHGPGVGAAAGLGWHAAGQRRHLTLVDRLGEQGRGGGAAYRSGSSGGMRVACGAGGNEQRASHKPRPERVC
jgi:hypothetical protein